MPSQWHLTTLWSLVDLYNIMCSMFQAVWTSRSVRGGSVWGQQSIPVHDCYQQLLSVCCYVLPRSVLSCYERWAPADEADRQVSLYKSCRILLIFVSLFGPMLLYTTDTVEIPVVHASRINYYYIVSVCFLLKYVFRHIEDS